MKICAIIATRDRPLKAGAVIEVSRSLATGLHELEFVVSCDEDDERTWRWYYQNYSAGKGVRVDIGPRPIGLGECFNRVETDADVVMCMGDDGFPATPYWDEIIACSTAAAFSWHDMGNPGQQTIICATKAWRELTAPMLDPRFPFWFSDTAAAEVYSFVHGAHMPILPIVMANRPGSSPNLRDLDFWWDFYAFTRRERLAQAAAIRATLGLREPPDLADYVRSWEERDARGRRFTAPEPATKPSGRYLIAFAKAEAAMQRAAA